MTDIKISSSTTRKPRKGRQSTVNLMPYTSPRVNQMWYTSSWTITTLRSGTSGSISSAVGVSIQSSSEYSSLSTIFSQIRLHRATIMFGSRVPNDSSVTTSHARILVGTRMDANANSLSAPSGWSGVQNTVNIKEVSSFNRSNMTAVNLKVPRNLEYSNIAADAPATATPWAGSPGAWYIYGDGFTNSTDYFTVIIKAMWQLRGRG